MIIKLLTILLLTFWGLSLINNNYDKPNDHNDFNTDDNYYNNNYYYNNDVSNDVSNNN